MINRRTIFCLVTAVVAQTALPAMAQTPGRIQLTQLEEMFASMRAKTKWNVDGPLLWGYFFLDPSEGKLQAAAKELDAIGYHVVGVQQVGARQFFRLHVERVETHTPSSLNARNSEFYAFVEKRSLASYDGMDVGPAPATAK
jgi:hypothetical protein